MFLTLCSRVQADDSLYTTAALSSHGLLIARESRSSAITTPSFARAAAKPAAQPLPTYHIPTPDASRQVQNYDALYQAKRWTEPSTYIRYSETVEQVSYGMGGFGYDMDDKDAEWLQAFNSKEEGSSGSAGQATSNGVDGVQGNQAGRPSRGNKGKDREKDQTTPLRISDDEFEYIMGMFEKWIDKHVPMLHTVRDCFEYLLVTWEATS